MSETEEVAKQEPKELQKSRESERTIRPAAGIFEDSTGITVRADMPGVSKDRLNIRVDRNTLSIMGEINIPMPEGVEALYADVRATRYKRSFTLSGEMDTENIDASLKDGVLTLRIPKREEYKARKIEVSTE